MPRSVVELASDSDGKEAVVAEKQGKPGAVVTTPGVDEQSERQREQQIERFWRAVERIGERNKDKDPDEVLAEVTEVVEEVRRERYERKRAKDGR